MPASSATGHAGKFGYLPEFAYGSRAIEEARQIEREERGEGAAGVWERIIGKFV
jgi:hypothetical protein